MSKKVQPYTHCAACSTPLSDCQSVYRLTGKSDDLCNACRSAVRRAVFFHDDDQAELESGSWSDLLEGQGVLGFPAGITPMRNVGF